MADSINGLGAYSVWHGLPSICLHGARLRSFAVLIHKHYHLVHH